MQLRQVGVWVMCSGIQADAPMRALLNKSLQPTAERGCDMCGLIAKKGIFNTCKYLGYDKPCDCHVWNQDTAEYGGEAEAWAVGKVRCLKNPGKNKKARLAVGGHSTHIPSSAMVQRDKQFLTEVGNLPSDGKRAATERLQSAYGSKGCQSMSRRVCDTGMLRCMHQWRCSTAPTWELLSSSWATSQPDLVSAALHQGIWCYLSAVPRTPNW